MTCREFLARHAEYMDDLELLDSARWEEHLAACASCAHYDRVVRQAVRLVRAFPEVEPSLDFFPRLQHRLYNLEDELRVSARGPGTGAMVSLAIAGVLALLAWSPLLRLDQMLLPVGGASGAWTASEAATGASVGRSATVEAERRSVADQPGRGLPSISEPSRLQQARLVSESWVAPNRAVDEYMGTWVGTEIFDEFSHGFDRMLAETRPAATAPVWWWTGTKFTEPALLRHNSRTPVAPRLPGPYPSQSPGAQSVRSTSDTVLPRN